MKPNRRVGLVITALLGISISLHAHAAIAASIPVGVASEMASLFDEMCLKAFPDQHAVEKLAGSTGFKPMPHAETVTLLDNSPGRGWIKSTALSSYTVTVAGPPSLSCSVRRSGTYSADSIESYITVIAAYATSHGASLHSLPPFPTRNANGDEFRAIPVLMLPGSSGMPMERFTVVGTSRRVVPGHNRVVEITFIHSFLGGDRVPS